MVGDFHLSHGESFSVDLENKQRHDIVAWENDKFPYHKKGWERICSCEERLYQIHIWPIFISTSAQCFLAQWVDAAKALLLNRSEREGGYGNKRSWYAHGALDKKKRLTFSQTWSPSFDLLLGLPVQLLRWEGDIHRKAFSHNGHGWEHVDEWSTVRGSVRGNQSVSSPLIRVSLLRCAGFPCACPWPLSAEPEEPK